MPCFHPVKGFKGINGGIAFDTKYGYADFPMQVPCGRCTGCRVSYSRQWAARCLHEAQTHQENCFVTLTYDDANLPTGGSLVPKHFTDFMKRLRRSISPKKVSFFHCGEYGDDYQRPHYHALLFGHWFDDANPIPGKSKSGKTQFRSAKLEKLWGKGHCTIGAVTYQSAAYCSRYILKKKSLDNYERLDPSTGEIITLVREYATMSVNPAIGKRWFESFGEEVFPDDFVIVDGKKHQVPRYYDKLLKRKEITAHHDLKKDRKSSMHKPAVLANSRPARLAAREAVLTSRINLTKRDL